MRKADFEELWQTEKSITDDIVFRLNPCISKRYQFDDIDVIGHESHDVLVNGVYLCGSREVIFNFVVIESGGAICRYCLGGGDHGGGGRYHQHVIGTDDCVRRQLPHVVPRPDLKGLTAKQVWERVWAEARITHTGKFFEPEVLC
jgi:hypothetical protein